MIQVEIPDEVVEMAKERAALHRWSESRGLSKFGSERGRTEFGYIGEIVVARFLGVTASADEFDYDLVSNGKRLEVKTISCGSEPKPHYLCTVNSHNLAGTHHQDADYYVFVRVLANKKRAWILGYLPCAEFFSKGTFVQRGAEVVPGVVFKKANATVLPIFALKSLDGRGK